jgi:hypothetical protein
VKTATGLRRIALLGLVFLLSLLIAELLLNVAWISSGRVRWAMLAPWERTEYIKDPVLNFKGNPDHPEHDQSGFRNSNTPEQVDIVTIGDSQTYGVGVGREATWPQQLAAVTGKSVYNLSVSGWGPVQYRTQIEQALGLHPEVVMVGLYLGNDIYDAYHLTYEWETGAHLRDPVAFRLIKEFEDRQQMSAPSLVTAIGQEDQDKVVVSQRSSLTSYLSSQSKLYALARGFWHMASGYEVGYTPWTTESRDDYWFRLKQLARIHPEQMIAFESGKIRTILTPSYRMPGINIDDPRIAEGVEVTLRALGEIYTHCINQGIELLIVILPTKEYTFSPFLTASEHNSRAMQLSRLTDRLEHELRKRIFTVLGEKMIDYLDMLPALRQTIAQDQEHPFFESRNGHFDASGHGVIAHSVALRYLIRNPGL